MARETRPIDRIDRKILEILQRDARITNARLAERVNLSARSAFVEQLRQRFA